MARFWICSIVALSAIVPGAFILLRSLGVFGPIATTPDGPAWLGALIGLVFVAGGCSALITTFYGDASSGDLSASAPVAVRLFRNVLGFAIVAGLATLFSWVGFGPGEWKFSGSGAFLGPGFGRAMFDLAAMLTWAVLAWITLRGLKRRLFGSGESD